MRKEIGILALLVCLLVAPAWGLGLVEIYDGSSGEIIGDESYVCADSLNDYKNNGVKASVTEGMKVKALIPAGYQGEVAAWLPAFGSNSQTVDLLGEKYQLSANTNGYVGVGISKTSNNGKMTAEAEISARSEADNGFIDPIMYPGCLKNLLSGEAKIYAKTSSTATGKTYAIAQGNAYFNAKQSDCPCPQPKEVKGKVCGTVELQDLNKECTCPDECTCVQPAPSGTKTGEGGIYAAATANNFKSYANAKTSLSVSATRTKKGVSIIDGVIAGPYFNPNCPSVSEACADAYAWDGTTSSPTYYNPNAEAHVDAASLVVAAAFAANDKSTANTYMTSEAWHNLDNNKQYNKAYNTAYGYMSVKRADLNNPNNLAFAAAATTGDFLAYSRDNTVANKYAFERANVNINLEYGQLQKISNIYSSVDLKLTAQRNGQNSVATIENTVKNYGPKTGDADDASLVYEDLSNLRAEARSPNEFRFVDLTNKDVASFIDGNDPVATGSYNIAAPTFGAGTNSESIVPASGTTTTNKFWTLTYKAKND